MVTLVAAVTLNTFNEIMLVPIGEPLGSFGEFISR